MALMVKSIFKLPLLRLTSYLHKRLLIKPSHLNARVLWLK
ncbi:hypothetical protein BTN49_1961 [Candidatus Enterovibrio escicola]|uniref:Uncharacterized protein n=1 Tax=Candidatus Enterovibrio escicola TaxID=1927127 RepID=A0A2A5T2N6_9GAMM|nr:hypothetical protein BTN49_1961 [Candidatus Enterovibrio escacola]